MTAFVGDDEPNLPDADWCPDCGCSRYVAEWDWDVDVAKDGPDGPECEFAILDCGHYVTTGRKRAQGTSR